MAYIRLIRVFLSSPGDVTEERQIALDEIARLPNRPAFREKVAFRVIAWDKPEAGTPMRATLSPQEAINQGLPRPSECDIVIVFLWSRMGTPFVLNGQEYQSGTHWELLDALNSGRPQTFIYRRTEEKMFRATDTEGQEQYRRVETFFKSDLFYDPDTGIIRRGVNYYQTPDDFRKQFETHLEELVMELLQQPDVDAPPVPLPENTPNITTITSMPWLGSPFPGLRAFTPADTPIFFGRGQETDALVKRIGENRFVTVVGASGSGKSSLVGAGLIPRLKGNAIEGSKDWLLPEYEQGRGWSELRFTPGELGDNPFMALAAKLAPLSGDTPRELAVRLSQEAGEMIAATEKALAGKPKWAEVLLFIDQFEELFTLVHPQYVDAFVDLLIMAIQSQHIRTIVTLRADFYAHCVEIPKLADILEETTFPLSAPIPAELREMIVRPAEQAGLEFEDGLPERILADTGTEPGALALMAYALDELYHSGVDDRRLTHTAYEALGGVHKAIGKRAEKVFLKLDTEAQNALPTVFREIVEVDERGEPTRRRAELRMVTPDASAKQLVEALAGERARLLVQDRDPQGRPMVEVAHEALLRQWPRLSSWIESEQDNLRLRRQIQQAAQEWEVHERAAGYLLMGSRLQDAKQWLKVFSAGQTEREFILASTEAEVRQRKAERLLRQIAAALGILLLILLAGIAGIAIMQSNQAQAGLATAQWQGTVDGFQQAYRQTQVAGATLIVDPTRIPETVVAIMTRLAELNAWKPVMKSFDGVEMMMVPSGCFLMGGTGAADELPMHEQCFEQPFWIDRYEVTNAQFGSTRCTEQPNQPRNCVSWYEARDHCAQRGVRLPTEAEWEYAARGPNSLVYPWGNEFVADNVIDFINNAITEPAAVGSRPGGASWVGTLDMSGSVWEWVSTIYDQVNFPYPYDPNDGREDLNRTDVLRVLRGGSFDTPDNRLRAAAHGSNNPEHGNDRIGFRCARSE